MVCYQVLAQFAFYQEPLGSYKPFLVSTHIKKQEVKAFLVLSRLPFGSRLKYRRFFHTKKEAAQYVSYLHTGYKNRIISSPRQELAREILSVSRYKTPHGVGLKKYRGTQLIYQAPSSGGQLLLF
jgi:hypothetical protein